jgi:MoaA/NifB/PqqE/SkfB family radical SAM enzyme
MVTNGRKLSDYYFVQAIKKAGLSSLTVSIEGSNSFVHDSITKYLGVLMKLLRYRKFNKK